MVSTTLAQFVLTCANRDGSLAGRREYRAEPGRADLIVEAVGAVIEGMLHWTGIDARGVVGIPTGRVDGEVTPIADESRRRIAGPGDLGLVCCGPVPIDVRIEIEQAVIGPRVGPARGRELVARAGGIDRRRRGRGAGRKWLAGDIRRIVVDIAELDLMTERRSKRSFHDSGLDVVAGIRHDIAVTVPVALVRAVGAAREYFGIGCQARRGEGGGDAAQVVRTPQVVG
jgi:hypothetical protein